MHTTLLSIRRPLAASLLAAAAAALLTACGGSGASSVGGTATNSAGFVKYAACIRAHGVPSFPDPGSRGFDVSGSTNASSVTVAGHVVSQQVLQAAESRCAKDSPAVADAPKYTPAQLATFQAGIDAFSECIRSHGVPDYPDQKVVVGPGGRGFRYAVDGTAPKSYPAKAFSAAGNACGEILNRADKAAGH